MAFVTPLSFIHGGFSSPPPPPPPPVCLTGEGKLIELLLYLEEEGGREGRGCLRCDVCLCVICSEGDNGVFW